MAEATDVVAGDVEKEAEAAPALPHESDGSADEARPSERDVHADLTRSRELAGDGAVATENAETSAARPSVFGAASAAHALNPDEFDGTSQALAVLPRLLATEAIAPWTSRRAFGFIISPSIWERRSTSDGFTDRRAALFSG